ncbi:MAG: tRNA (adenosine(37)-N6)-threonylcarbamoyltransferase complex ATPase subunit type 1 TsaE [Steroidobacteraceae bacterium]
MKGTLLADEAATLDFAAQLARALPAGAAPLVLHLHGELGAGKTTLARGMLRALGETGPVRSPTYALLSEYMPPGGRVVHLDLYRLAGADELLALGLGDYLPDSRLWLVEWPDRAGGAGLPAADASVRIEVDASGRRVLLVPHTAVGQRWVTRVCADAG